MGLIFTRSGLGVKHGVALSNGVGVIDSDYRGELHVGLRNHSREAYAIQPGERVAQLVILPVCLPELAEVESSPRRPGARAALAAQAGKTRPGRISCGGFARKAHILGFSGFYRFM